MHLILIHSSNIRGLRRRLVCCLSLCSCVYVRAFEIASVPNAMKHSCNGVYCRHAALDIIVKFVHHFFFFIHSIVCSISASLFLLILIIFFFVFLFDFTSFVLPNKMPITCSRYNLQKPFVSIRRTRPSLKKYSGECVCMVPIYYLHHLFYHWQWLWLFVHAIPSV